MQLPALVPIEHRGELVALVSLRRTHIISPRVLAAPSGDAELLFVALMCACCAEVLDGRIPGPYTDALGRAWAQRTLSATKQNADAACETSLEGGGSQASMAAPTHCMRSVRGQPSRCWDSRSVS